MESNNNRMQKQQEPLPCSSTWSSRSSSDQADKAAVLRSQLAEVAVQQQRMAAAAEGMRWRGVVMKDQTAEPQAVRWKAASQPQASLQQQQQLLLAPSARDLASTSQPCSLSGAATGSGIGSSQPRPLRPILARRESLIMPSHAESNNDSPAARLVQVLSGCTSDTAPSHSGRVPASTLQQKEQQQSSDWSNMGPGYDAAESFSASGHMNQSLPTGIGGGYSDSMAAMLAGAENSSSAAPQQCFQSQQAGTQEENVFHQHLAQQDHNNLRCQLSVLREQELQQMLLQAQELERRQRIALKQREEELRQLLDAQATVEQSRKLQGSGAHGGLETQERMHSGRRTSSNGHTHAFREQEMQLHMFPSNRVTHPQRQDHLGSTEEAAHVSLASECLRQPSRLINGSSPTPLSSQRFWERNDYSHEQMGLGMPQSDQRSSTHQHESQDSAQLNANLNLNSQQQLERLLVMRRQTFLLQQQLKHERLAQGEVLRQDIASDKGHTSQAGRAENLAEQRLWRQQSQLERQLHAQLQLTDSLLKSMTSSDERNGWRHQQRVEAAYQNQSSDTQVMKASPDMVNPRSSYYQHQRSSESEQERIQSQQRTQRQMRPNRAVELQREDEEFFNSRARRRGNQEDSNSVWACDAYEGDSDASDRSPRLACRRRSSSRTCSQTRLKIGSRQEPRHRKKSGSRDWASPPRREPVVLMATSNQEERMALGKWMSKVASTRPHNTDGTAMSSTMRNAMEVTPDLTSSEEEDEDGEDYRQARPRRPEKMGPDGRRNTIEENLSSQLRRQNHPTKDGRSAGEDRKSQPPGAKAVPQNISLVSDSDEVDPKRAETEDPVKSESRPTDPTRRRSSDKGDKAGEQGEPSQEKRRNSRRQSIGQPTDTVSQPREMARKQSRRPSNLDSDEDEVVDSRRIERLRRREARRESRQSARPANEDESLPSSDEKQDLLRKRAVGSGPQPDDVELDSSPARRQSGGSSGGGGRPVMVRSENTDSRFQDDAKQDSESASPGVFEEAPMTDKQPPMSSRSTAGDSDIRPAERSVNKTMVSMGTLDNKEGQQQEPYLPYSLRSGWHSKHNKAAPDSTYTQDSDLHRGGPERTVDTDSDNDDPTSSMQQPRRPPPDTGSKVQLLDRRYMHQQAAAPEKQSTAPEASKPGAATTAARDTDGGRSSKVASLSEKKAMIKSVSRLPATEGAPTQVKPEDQLSEEDIEACKTRAAKKNEERRKRRENKATGELGDAAAEESDEEDDVAPLLQDEENVEKDDDPPDETDLAPVSDGAQREGREQRKPSVGGDGGARAPRRKSDPQPPVTRPRKPPPEKPPPPKAAAVARAPQPKPPPPQQRRRRRSSRSEAAARAVSVPAAKPAAVSMCCPPPPQCPYPPISYCCCVRCGMTSRCYPVAGGRAYCCSRCYMC